MRKPGEENPALQSSASQAPKVSDTPEIRVLSPSSPVVLAASPDRGEPVRPDVTTQAAFAPKPQAPPPPLPFQEEDLLKQKTRIGNFTLTGFLGKGGMGAVYLGEHEEIGKRVAIKLLKPSLATDYESVSRFLGEAKVITRLRHPSIVDVYDCGYRPDIGRYLIMEYLEGSDLQSYLKKQGGALSPFEAVSIAWQIADALEAAHDSGVIHRDLKPSNVYLVRWGKRTLVKLLDFGVAKLRDGISEDGLRTRTGVILGTPAYMAPEQAAGHKDLDGRVDVYSLGIILFELVTGRRPFVSQNSNEMLIMQQLEQPPPPVAFAPGLPAELEDLILRCLEKAPQDRPSGAGALRAELEKLLPSLPKEVLAIELSPLDLSVLEAPANPPKTLSYKKGEEQKPVDSQKETYPLLSPADPDDPARSIPEDTDKERASQRVSQQRTAIRPLQEMPSLVLEKEAPADLPSSVMEAKVIPAPEANLSIRSPRAHLDMMALRAVATGQKLPPGLLTGEHVPPPEESFGKRHPRLILGAAALVSALLVLGVFFLIAPTPGLLEKGTPQPSPSGSPFVEVLLDSSPGGAEVLDPNGERLGKTPCSLQIPPEGLQVRVVLEGFKEITLPLGPQSPPQLTIPLEQK